MVLRVSFLPDGKPSPGAPGPASSKAWPSGPGGGRRPSPARHGMGPVLGLLVGLTVLTGCNAVRYGLPTLQAPASEELVLALPPLDLPAGVDHHTSPQPIPLDAEFPVDGWAQGFVVEVVDREGREVPESVLHHVKVLATERRELFNPIALRLVGAGSETRAADLPARAGVPLRQGDPLLVTAMVHNPTQEALTGVQVRVRLRYLRSDDAPGMSTVYPFFMHVTAPDEPSDYDLPPGRSERSWEARPAVGGRVLMLGGHLHRYGVGLRLEDAGSGRVIWETTPVVGENGDIHDVPRRSYTWSRGPRLDPDRTYRVTATYDNPTGKTLPGAGMGTVGGVLRPEARWLDRDAQDPLYMWDLAREREGAHGGGHAHEHWHEPEPGHDPEHGHDHGSGSDAAAGSTTPADATAPEGPARTGAPRPPFPGGGGPPLPRSPAGGLGPG